MSKEFIVRKTYDLGNGRKKVIISIDPTWQVLAGSDDCYRDLGSTPHFFLDLTNGEVGYDTTLYCKVGGGMRFTNITIPKGSTIDSAYLTLRATANYSVTGVDSRISAEDVDDAPTFANNAAAFDTRWAARTTARINWDNISAWVSNTDYNSPEIKTVIQEVINRAGWVSGNDIVIFWEDFEDRSTHTANCIRCYRSYEAGSYAPKLTITYTPPVVAPTVTTQAATSIEATTCTGNGNITATGGVNCTRRGFCYKVGTSGDPTIADSVAYDDGSFGTGAYTKAISGLSTGTSYRVRAYAINTAGTGYGTTVQILTKPAAPTNVLATDGTYTDKVVITWTKSTGATGYQVYRDSIGLGWIGDLATHNDVGASAPTITPGTATASDGTSAVHVALSLAGQTANNGTTHTYKVRAKNSTGESVDSGTNTGYRAPGTLTYQWQRSADDSDANYSSISGATTAAYNDTGAPVSGVGRYYKCIEDATGATQRISTVDRGYRIAASSHKLTCTIGDVIDCTALVDTYDSLEWTETIPSANQDIVISVRSSPDNINWTVWEAIYSTPCTSFATPIQRYFEWKAAITTTDEFVYATLSSLTFDWSVKAT